MGFSFSYTKLKNFKTCRRRYYEIDVKKNFKDGGDGMGYGLTVHEDLARAAITHTPLKKELHMYQKWVDTYSDPSLPGKLYVEQQLAITKQFQPTYWKDWNNAWYRGVVDLLRIYGPVAVAVDWKTGKMVHESRQLMLNAQAIFSHYPEVKRVHTEFVWLKPEYDIPTREVFDRDTIRNEWPPVLAEVKEMETAAKLNAYPPTRSGLCFKYCPVTTCPFHGKRPNERVDITES